MFYTYIWTNCQFYQLKYKTTPDILWKATTTLAWIMQINYTERVIFCANSWQFYLGPGIFYTIQDCDFRDKFHVCLLLNPISNFVKFFLLRIRFYVTLFLSWQPNFFKILKSEYTIQLMWIQCHWKKGRKRETLENSWMNTNKDEAE